MACSSCGRGHAPQSSHRELRRLGSAAAGGDRQRPASPASQPGFELENFVVHDDPTFSAEPVLRAQEVTAFLRLNSLLRGRLEISRLSLTEPSLNLTRNDDGHWNIEHLLERTAKTAWRHRQGSVRVAPGVSYIEAERAGSTSSSARKESPLP